MPTEFWKLSHGSDKQLLWLLTFSAVTGQGKHLLTPNLTHRKTKSSGIPLPKIVLQRCSYKKGRAAIPSVNWLLMLYITLHITLVKCLRSSGTQLPCFFHLHLVQECVLLALLRLKEYQSQWYIEVTWLYWRCSLIRMVSRWLSLTAVRRIVGYVYSNLLCKS